MDEIIFKIKYPLEIYGLRSKNGVYDKEASSCNDHCDKNSF